MRVNITIDIDTELGLLEEYFLNYIGDTSFIYSCRYLPHIRGPINGLSNINKVKDTYGLVVSNTPYLPFLCIPLILEIFDLVCVEQIPDKIRYLFYNNVYLPKDKGEVIYNYADYLPSREHVVRSYIPNISIEHLNNIYGILNSIKDKLLKYIDGKRDHVYKLNTSSNVIILEDHGEIGSYRYNELLEHRDIDSSYGITSNDLDIEDYLDMKDY